MNGLHPHFLLNWILGLTLLLIVISCADPEKTDGPARQNTEVNWQLPRLPADQEAILRSVFPGARPAPEFGDSIFKYLNSKYGITKKNILLGASMCADDIIYTKNFHSQPEIKGPFHLGGLAGLPFCGTSGLEAFAHHIPEGGTMLLLVETHIGYTSKKGWGYILRHQQHEVSTCCGALMGTLAKLNSGSLNNKISEEDYQGGKIAELALYHKDKILNSPIPIVSFSQLTSLEAERQIRDQVLKVDLQHIDYIVILTGVMINTDFTYTDYQCLEHLLVYDVKKKSFVEEKKFQ